MAEVPRPQPLKTMQQFISGLTAVPAARSELQKAISRVCSDFGVSLQAFSLWLPMQAFLSQGRGAGMLPTIETMVKRMQREGWDMLPINLPGDAFKPKPGDMWVRLDRVTGAPEAAGWVLKIYNHDTILDLNGDKVEFGKVSYLLRETCSPCREAALRRAAEKRSGKGEDSDRGNRETEGTPEDAVANEETPSAESVVALDEA